LVVEIKKLDLDRFDKNDILKKLSSHRENIAMFACVIDDDTKDYCHLNILEVEQEDGESK
jgi:hypothetical protein